MAMRPGSVSYLNVSQYVTLNAGTYTVRAVPGSRSDCSVFAYGGLPDLALPQIAAGRTYTLIPVWRSDPHWHNQDQPLWDDLGSQGGKFDCGLSMCRQMCRRRTLASGWGGYKPLLTDALQGRLGALGGNDLCDGVPQTNGSASVRPSGMTTDLLTTGAVVKFCRWGCVYNADWWFCQTQGVDGPSGPETDRVRRQQSAGEWSVHLYPAQPASAPKSPKSRSLPACRGQRRWSAQCQQRTQPIPGLLPRPLMR